MTNNQNFNEATPVNPFVVYYDKEQNPNKVIDTHHNFKDPDRVLDERPMQYPESAEYDYTFSPVVLNMDEECARDFDTDNGFRITHRQKVNQNIKNIDGIFSSRFGQGLQDEAPFQTRYRCKCGKLMGKLNNKFVCPSCHTPVKFTGDNFEYFGWIILDNYCYIHPLLYSHIRNFIGPVFEQIILYDGELDQNGTPVEKQYTNQEDSFKGIGITGFQNRFEEIMDYYAAKHKSKAANYEFIMKHKDKVFAHCLPVYSLLLRPIKIKDGHFCFEGTNSDYNIIAAESMKLNSGAKVLTMKNVEGLLYHIQMKFMNVIDTINQILTGKKGTIRGLYGGRYNFIARCVIIPDKTLGVDEISLPYLCIMNMMKEVIINVIKKTYHISYIDAYARWFEGLLKIDDVIAGIIDSLIKNNPSGRGLPVIINRNPTLHYGSIMQMYCTKVNFDSYAMGLPLQVLKPLNADFDGDVVNCMWIINRQFLEDAERVFNPRNAMFIDRNTGYMNADMCPNGETIINANNLVALARDSYTVEEKAMIKHIVERNRS